jgi:NAD(P)-dependent dehydrogenase (short-subunit alcohol dehydrogenase family)
LRQEPQEDNIRITMIEPGAVATELTNHITDEEAKEGVSGMIAAMEPLQSEDIANAIAYVVTQPERVSINEVLIRPPINRTNRSARQLAVSGGVMVCQSERSEKRSGLGAAGHTPQPRS